VRRGLPVLGVCLGAQLIASALGARVFANAHREIGWFPIQSVYGNAGAFRFPEQTTVFHWHGETFDLPPGALHLARSSGCEHQAFQVGASALGLQFHLETTPESADQIIRHCRDDLVPGEYVQSEDELLAVADEAYRGINRLMDEVLSYLTIKWC
jgi:GMP synthase-like glutamine amidotransferase